MRILPLDQNQTNKKNNEIAAKELIHQNSYDQTTTQFLIDPFNNVPPPRRQFSRDYELTLNLPDMKNLRDVFSQKVIQAAKEIKLEKKSITGIKSVHK